MTRSQWKAWWRQVRIIKRESLKAAEDMWLFGTGYVKIGEDVPDLIQHIPLETLRFRPDGSVIA